MNPVCELFSSGYIQIRHIAKMKHVLSHQTIFATFYMVEAPEDMFMDEKYLRIKTEDVDAYPVSRLSHKYLEAL